MSVNTNQFLGIMVILTLAACGKSPVTPPGNQNNNGGKNCLLSIISQVNAGGSTESSLLAYYNDKYDVSKIIVYDSVNKIKNFEAVFFYITIDSVRIDDFQYLKLDADKRVIKFVTRSDMADPANADVYTFQYTYSGDGYLSKKDLFINGSGKAYLSSVYTYANQQLTGCLMTSPASGGQKVLESVLTYDNSITIKNWIYSIPDAIEGYPFLSILNFGKPPVNPLNKVITRIYDPASGNLLDTWTTNYRNYKTDANGYLISGEAIGDQQQGIASFFGKTNFYYTCH